MFVALVVLTALVGVIAYFTIAHSRVSGRAAFNARTEVATLVQLVLDQETGVRGYTQTREAVFLQPYNHATIAYPAAMAQLRADTLGAPPSVRAHIESFDIEHTTWVRSTLVPLISGRERDRSGTAVGRKSTP